MNEDIKTCPQCGDVMEPVIENVGFESPDPTMEELIGYECLECKYWEDA